MTSRMESPCPTSMAVISITPARICGREGQTQSRPQRQTAVLREAQAAQRVRAAPPTSPAPAPRAKPGSSPAKAWRRADRQSTRPPSARRQASAQFPRSLRAQGRKSKPRVWPTSSKYIPDRPRPRRRASAPASAESPPIRRHSHGGRAMKVIGHQQRQPRLHQRRNENQFARRQSRRA